MKQNPKIRSAQDYTWGREKKKKKGADQNC